MAPATAPAASTAASAQQADAFPTLNAGYQRVFRSGQLTVGVVAPLEAYQHDTVPSLHRHVERAVLVDQLGFAALWLRDVPFDVPSFGDAGQVFDPFVYLGLLAGQTRHIALGLASAVLPLRHPAHLAKAAASADVLSGGRMLLGIASGDRPEEYPAFGSHFATRGETYRQAYDYLHHVWRGGALENSLGRVGAGMRLLPRPTACQVPLLITGHSQQDATWITGHGDGWMTYPRPLPLQAELIRTWRAGVGATTGHDKPVMQPLYVDLTPDEFSPSQPIHLGFRLGLRALRDHLYRLRDIGVNHVALNLRFNREDVEATLHRLADGLLRDFGPAHATRSEASP